MDNLHKNIVKLHHFECYDYFIREVMNGSWKNIARLIKSLKHSTVTCVINGFDWENSNDEGFWCSLNPKYEDTEADEISQLNIQSPNKVIAKYNKMLN